MPKYQYDKIEPNSQRWLSLQDLPNEEWLPIKGYEQSLEQSKKLAEILPFESADSIH